TRPSRCSCSSPCACSSTSGCPTRTTRRSTPSSPVCATGPISSSRSPTVPAEGLAERPVRDARPIGIAAVDGCVFHEWPGPQALAPYLPEGWRRMLMRDGNPINPGSIWRFTHPRGEQDVAALPASGPPGSDLELLVAQTLGGGLRERVVLGY